MSDRLTATPETRLNWYEAGGRTDLTAAQRRRHAKKTSRYNRLKKEKRYARLTKERKALHKRRASQALEASA